MKKTWFIITSVGVMFLVIFIIFSLKREKKGFSYKNMENLIISEKYWTEFSSQNSIISNCYIFDFQNDNDSVYLSDILNNSPKLVFWFSESSCSICIEEELKNLVELSKIIKKEDIVIIGSFQNMRKRWMRESSFRIFNLRKERLGMAIENNNFPFYFIADETLEAKFVFMPVKELPILTEKYFKIITEKYF